VAVRRKAGDASARAKGNSGQSRRSRPPWGNLLGGKPIERQIWAFGKKIDRREQRVLGRQYARMLALKRHYGIVGGDYDYPIKGVGPTEWLPWYLLALAIASDLDNSLQVVDAPKPKKTTARWRGRDGMMLLCLVEFELQRSAQKRRTVRWCLEGYERDIPRHAKFRSMCLLYVTTRPNGTRRVRSGCINPSILRSCFLR
jgi:hypothetical protein